MVVEVERVVEVDAAIDEVWEILSDPARRARAISVVDSFRVEGQEYVWQVELPIPLVRRTISVRTRDEERDPPTFVRFVGRSKAFTVEGEHELTALESGTRVRSRFAVDGKLPGVERYFERNIDDELSNLVGSINAKGV
ncbi:SRPBCC family protein [Salinarchaeum chitinilyticum]